MAKKKIGDIATAHDLNPKEVVKQLQEAGFSVQNQRSTIDEGLALKVLGVGDGAAGNGGQAQPADTPPKPRRVQPVGSQPRPQERRPPRDDKAQGGRGPQGQGQRGPQGQRGGQQGQRPGGQRPQGERPQRPDAAPPQQLSGGQREGGRPPRSGRPTRDDQRTGERAPSNAGGPRRVVIDSQASRRQGPGGG